LIPAQAITSSVLSSKEEDLPLSNDFRKWINDNPGKVLGILAGLLFGIFFFLFGLWKMVLILSLMFVGYIIGKSFDENISLIDAVKRIFRREDD